MDDLYDEFGNFIGEEVEGSEADSGHDVDAGNYVYDDDHEEAPEVAGHELMEIDGMFPHLRTRKCGPVAI